MIDLTWQGHELLQRVPCQLAARLQVSCNPPGLIVVDVQQLRTTAGGYIKLALDAVKGPGQLTGIALRQTPSPVSCNAA